MQNVSKFLRNGFFLILALFVMSGISRGQPTGDALQISLITCGPGKDLYSTFGHTAIRVTDHTRGEDYIFNYGTFDFSTPHFYWKFIRGRLMYFLSVQDFYSFIETYKEENRKVSEQILNLSPEEKEEIWQFLRTNYLPANRYYKYDFLFDNCSTRIRDIFSNIFGASWKIDNIIPVPGLSFRDIINTYLKSNPWEKLGINLMFGKRADQEMTNRQIMFLPYFLEQGASHSRIAGKPLVMETRELYTPRPEPSSGTPFYQFPIFWLGLAGLFIIILSFAGQGSFSIILLQWIDRCLFFLTGLLGCFLLFMWWGTDHEICTDNFNLLWLFPLNLLFSFYFFKNSGWVRGYATFLLLLNIFLLAGWFFLPQEFPIAAIPIIVVLAVRCRWILIRPRLGYRK